MSGYGGNPDIDAEQQIIMAENGIDAARSMIPKGPSASHCLDCAEPIPEARRLAQSGCQYCITCQPQHDTLPRVKMLTGSLD